jgi:hypothetical protein
MAAATSAARRSGGSRAGIVIILHAPGDAGATVAHDPHYRLVDASVQITTQAVVGEEGGQLGQQAHGREPTAGYRRARGPLAGAQGWYSPVGMTLEREHNGRTIEVKSYKSTDGRWRPGVKVETLLTANSIRVQTVPVPRNTLFDSEGQADECGDQLAVRWIDEQ